MDNQIKLLIVIPTLGGGGAERFVSIILRHLNPEEFEAHVALFDHSGRYLPDIPDTVRIHNLRKRSKWDYPRVAIRLGRILRRERPDIVYSFMWQANTLTMIAVALSGRKPKTILGVRTFPSLHFARARFGRVHEYLVRTLYPRASVVLTNSEAAMEDMNAHYGVPRDRLRALYNPVDVSRVNELAREDVIEPWYPRDRPVVLAAGSLAWQKDYPTLLRAFCEVRTRQEAALVILGEGALRAELESLVKELGLELGRDALLPGVANNPYKFMARASVFVLSSQVEGFPNVVLEAMACGKPVVATRCPSGPEEIITHEENGLLVGVGDASELAAAMERVLNDAELAARLGENASRRAADFDIRTVIPQYVTLFQALATKQPE